VLVVDAAQGIEAQTLANVYLALAQGLVIIPVLNKIDLPSAQPEVVIEELENVLAIPREEVILVSAKDGTNVEAVLEAIVVRVPPPTGDASAPLQGLIFDSHYDAYKGVVVSSACQGAPPRRHPPDGLRSGTSRAGIFGPSSCRSRPSARWATWPRASSGRDARSATPSRARSTGAPLPGYQAGQGLVFANLYP
jgi:GTP-binding protein LepA